MSGQLDAPAALSPGKSPRYPLYRRLGGHHSRSGRLEKWKFLTIPGLELRPLGRPAHGQWSVSLPTTLSRLRDEIYHAGFRFSQWCLWRVLYSCSPLKNNRCYGGTCHLHLQCRRISRARNQHEDDSKQTLKMEAIYSYEVSVDFQRTTGRYISQNIEIWIHIHLWYCDMSTHCWVTQQRLCNPFPSTSR
jgi:hypothetical protein